MGMHHEFVGIISCSYTAGEMLELRDLVQDLERVRAAGAVQEQFKKPLVYDWDEGGDFPDDWDFPTPPSRLR